MNIQEEVFEMIRAERERQDEKWGPQRALYPNEWYLILGEEIGEVANAILESKPDAEIEEELVQVAAVVVCWLEALRHE